MPVFMTPNVRNRDHGVVKQTNKQTNLTYNVTVYTEIKSADDMHMTPFMWPYLYKAKTSPQTGWPHSRGTTVLNNNDNNSNNDLKNKNN